jgi:hypothetical protein
VTALAGAVTIQCQICGRHVNIPMRVHETQLDGNDHLMMLIEPNRAVVRAHALTHTARDGQPADAAA